MHFRNNILFLLVFTFTCTDLKLMAKELSLLLMNAHTFYMSLIFCVFSIKEVIVWKEGLARELHLKVRECGKEGRRERERGRDERRE